MSIMERCRKIAAILDEKKAEHIEIFDLSDTDYFVDAVVVATQVASKHALMLIDEIKALKKDGENVLNVDDSDDWTIIDMGDILVHLMSETYRKKYNLEEFLREFEANKRS